MRPWYAFCRFWCQVTFLFFFRGRVFGRRHVPRTGGVLLVCNHQSYLDPVLAGLSLPRECHFMARDTLFKHEKFRWLIDSLNAFPIKRGTADIASIKETLRRLKGGALITVFPEGTRTPNGQVLPMQSGVALIARKAGVPMVPTLVLGAFEAWPRHSKLPLPLPIVVAYGEPLTPGQVAAMDETACMAELRRRIIGLMERYAVHPLVRGRLAARAFDGVAAEPIETAV